jgi:hypothetical protein
MHPDQNSRMDGPLSTLFAAGDTNVGNGLAVWRRRCDRIERLHRWSPVMRYTYGWERVGTVQRARPNAVTVSTPAGSTLRLTTTRGIWLRQCEVYALGERPNDQVEER